MNILFLFVNVQFTNCTQGDELEKWQLVTFARVEQLWPLLTVRVLFMFKCACCLCSKLDSKLDLPTGEFTHIIGETSRGISPLQGDFLASRGISTPVSCCPVTMATRVYIQPLAYRPRPYSDIIGHTPSVAQVETAVRGSIPPLKSMGSMPSNNLELVKNYTCYKVDTYITGKVETT